MGSLILHTLIWSGVAHLAQAPSPNQAQVEVRAVQGDVPEHLVKSTCKAIEANFTLPCRYTYVGKPAGWNNANHRIDAASFLDAQFSHSASSTNPKRASKKGGQIVLWLTSKDLYEGSRPFVFGIMSMTDRIGIVSTHRIWDPMSMNVTEKRLQKVVVHELAHALDLGHHDLDSCVMQVEPDLAHLDKGSSSLCEHCRKRAASTTRRIQRKGQFLWDRANGHKVRGELRQAQNLLLPLIREPRVNPELKARAQAMWSRLLTK